MIIPIPDDRDAEEYIDELLDAILADEFRYNVMFHGQLSASTRELKREKGETELYSEDLY